MGNLNRRVPGRKTTASTGTSDASGAPLAVKSGTRSRRADGSSTAPESMCAPVSRAFSSTAIASGSPPFSFCSCASRSAADMPAGPPPTMSTSTSNVSRSATLFVQFGDHGGHDLEEVARDPVVRDFEDRRLGILVDRDDRARAFHPDEMLDRARDAKRDVELWRNRLSRAANLPIHGQPPRVADRAGGGELGAHRLRELLRDLDMLLPLDAAADRNNALGLREIDRLFRFLERRFRLLANLRRVDRHGRAADRRRRASFLHRIRAERADLKRDEVWCGTFDDDIRLQLALEHRAHIRAPLHRDDVGDERPLQAGSERWREVARLVGMRQKYEIRFLGADQCLQRLDESVSRVVLQRGVRDRENLAHVCRSQLAGDRIDRGPEHRDLHRGAGILSRGNRFPGGAIQRAVARLPNDQDHNALASSRSRFTRSLAASAAPPEIICVFFPFSGKYTLAIRCMGADTAVPATFLISFFLAAMMPLSVA